MSVPDDLRKTFATIEKLRERIKALEARPTFNPVTQSVVTWRDESDPPDTSRRVWAEIQVGDWRETGAPRYFSPGWGTMGWSFVCPDAPLPLGARVLRWCELPTPPVVE